MATKGKFDHKAYAAEAAKLANHNEKTASVDFPVPPAGKTVGRFIEYIELGVQPRKAFAGKAKQPIAQVKIAFELLNKKNIREIEVDGKKIKLADRISPPPMALSLHDKAGFNGLYEQMRYGREDITHMAQMLGEPFLLDIVHNESTTKGKDGKEQKRTYANIKSIGAPQIEDPVAETVRQLTVPPALSDIKVFVFDNPSQEAWDTLFIDGSTEVKGADGTLTTKSKNYIQELIMKAKNFGGSALEQMIGGLDNLPEFAEESEDQLEEVAEEVLEEEVLEVEEELEAPAPVAKPVAKKPLQVVAKTATVKAPVSTAPVKTVTKPIAVKTTAKAATASPSKPAVAAKAAIPAKKVASAGKTATQQAVEDLGLFDE